MLLNSEIVLFLSRGSVWYDGDVEGSDHGARRMSSIEGEIVCEIVRSVRLLFRNINLTYYHILLRNTAAL